MTGLLRAEVAKVRIQTSSVLAAVLCLAYFLLHPVNNARFLRRSALGRRSNHLAIAIFPDEVSAFHAYRLLYEHNVSLEHLAIVGQGYSSPERVGLMRPVQVVLDKAMRIALLASLLGLVICGGLALLLDRLSWDLLWVLPLAGAMSGLFGAATGAIVGFLGEGTTVSLYRHHLRQGHYLLMMEGPEHLVRWGQEVLSYYSMPSFS